MPYNAPHDFVTTCFCIRAPVKKHESQKYFRLFSRHVLLQDLPAVAATTGAEPGSWYRLDIAYATEFEVKLISLALVYYAADMPNGKDGLLAFCQDIETDAKETYLGHDTPWTAPGSWKYRRILKTARTWITDALSRRRNGGDLQPVEHVAQHSFGIALTTTVIIEYRRRLVLIAKEGSRQPLFDPSGTSRKPKLRLNGMLPAIARTVLTEFGRLDKLLQRAVNDLPAEVLLIGSPDKSALKAALQDAEEHAAALHDEAEAAREKNDVLQGKLKAAQAQVTNGSFFIIRRLQRILSSNGSPRAGPDSHRHKEGAKRRRRTRRRPVRRSRSHAQGERRVEEQVESRTRGG